MIKLIWAMDQNWLLGSNNKIPWNYPSDLKYFQNITNNKTVLMGLSTYYSLKGYYKKRDLPFKKIYVASFENIKLDDAVVVTNLDLFIKNIDEELFIIGGKSIYEYFIPYANYLYITYILNSYHGDTYLNKFDLNKKFKLKSYYNEENLIFSVYERR